MSFHRAGTGSCFRERCSQFDLFGNGQNQNSPRKIQADLKIHCVSGETKGLLLLPGLPPRMDAGPSLQFPADRSSSSVCASLVWKPVFSQPFGGFYVVFLGSSEPVASQGQTVVRFYALNAAEI